MRYYKIILNGVLIAITTMMGCGPSELFSPVEPMFIDGLNPLGIAKGGDHLWISDSDHNRVIQVDKEGNTLSAIEELERPMHIDYANDQLYIPSYGLDAILITQADGSIDSLGLDLEMDAPAGVSKQGDRMAIADFYNHRILYYDGSKWSSFGGKKGEEAGAFDYPTDVQLMGDRIYVADAYNNRGQILDLQGNSLLVFGEEEEMNAATGIFVTEDLIALTDFENDRVIIFDHTGKVLQRIEDSLHKPTDVLIDDNLMYITNYKGGYISIYERN